MPIVTKPMAKETLVGPFWRLTPVLTWIYLFGMRFVWHYQKQTLMSTEIDDIV